MSSFLSRKLPLYSPTMSMLSNVVARLLALKVVLAYPPEAVMPRLALPYVVRSA